MRGSIDVNWKWMKRISLLSTTTCLACLVECTVEWPLGVHAACVCVRQPVAWP